MPAAKKAKYTFTLQNKLIVGVKETRMARQSAKVIINMEVKALLNAENVRRISGR